MELRMYLRILQRGRWIIVLTMLAALTASLIASLLTTPIYRASSRFVISPNAGMYDSAWDVVSSLDTLDRRSIINTDKELLASPSVYGSHPDMQKLDKADIEEHYDVKAVVVPDTNILKLTVDGPDPNVVLQIANAIGESAIEYINGLYSVYNFSLLDSPELETVPIRPTPLQNALLSLVVGGILGVGLAFVKDQLEDSFESLRRRRMIDAGSSAYTRSTFERMLNAELAQAPTAAHSMGLIHVRGLDDAFEALPKPMIERVLRHLTLIVKEELRGLDFVGRWSKSQLSVLLPSTTGAAAEATFRRIFELIAERVSLDEAGELTLDPQPSIGIAESLPEESGDQLIERVERATREAAAPGKGNIVIA